MESSNRKKISLFAHFTESEQNIEQSSIPSKVSSYETALDLSCKKHSTSTIIKIKDDATHSFDTVSLNKMNQQEKHSNNIEQNIEKKRAPECSTVILTPSNSNSPISPKKIIYEQIYPSKFVHTNLPMEIPNMSTWLANQEIMQQVPMSMPSVLTLTQTHTLPAESESSAVTSNTIKKPQRPFTKYTKNLMSLSVANLDDYQPTEGLPAYRDRMLLSIRQANKGTNLKMRRVKVSKSPALPTSTVDEKDAAYWERRKKNNEAAKRSRDARRAKEDEIAIRAAFYERENMQLKFDLMKCMEELKELKRIIYLN